MIRAGARTPKRIAPSPTQPLGLCSDMFPHLRILFSKIAGSQTSAESINQRSGFARFGRMKCWLINRGVQETTSPIRSSACEPNGARQPKSE
jgi:hypothetical protein